jgi:hypothetical protein
MVLLFALLAGAALALSPPEVEVHQNTTNIPKPLLLQWPPKPPYDHTVKELGTFKTAAECEAACVAYRNTDVSPVSGWTLCQSYTWLAGRCVAVVDAMEWLPHKDMHAVSGRLTWFVAASCCHTVCHNLVCASQAASCLRL